MVATPSTMLSLGTRLPAFRLPVVCGGTPAVSGETVASSDLVGEPLLVAFICVHCPFVQHIRAEFSRFAQEYQARGLSIVAINSNDVGAFPEDGPDGMRSEAREAGYVFPYLFDETQEVAKAFHAACTPDLFLFDRSGTLVYRGQFDGSRPRSAVPVTGSDIRAAADAVLEGQPVSSSQRPSMGCNIKWKPGHEPDDRP